MNLSWSDTASPSRPSGEREGPIAARLQWGSESDSDEAPVRRQPMRLRLRPSSDGGAADEGTLVTQLRDEVGQLRAEIGELRARLARLEDSSH